MSSRKIIKTSKAPKAIGPYNQAIVSNGLVFLSGQIALDPLTGNLNLSNIDAEFHQVMRNVQAILKEAGTSISSAIKVSIFLSDMSLYGRVNELYSEYFGSDAPARECVAVKGLPKDVNVEISLVASV